MAREPRSFGPSFFFSLLFLLLLVEMDWVEVRWVSVGRLSGLLPAGWPVVPDTGMPTLLVRAPSQGLGMHSAFVQGAGPWVGVGVVLSCAPAGVLWPPWPPP